MTPAKKRTTAKARVSFKDLKSKKDAKGGCCAGTHYSQVKFLKID